MSKTTLNDLMPEEELAEWLANLPPMPTIEEAKEILKNSKLINPGTEDEFVQGYMGNRYRDAVTVLELEFTQIKKLLEEKG